MAFADFAFLRWVTGEADPERAWEKYFTDTQIHARKGLDQILASFHPQEGERARELAGSVEVFCLPSGAVESRVFENPGGATGYLIGIALLPVQIAAEIAVGIQAIHPRYPETLPADWDAGEYRELLDFTIAEYVRSLETPNHGPLPQSVIRTMEQETSSHWPQGMGPSDYKAAAMVFAIAHELAHIQHGHLLPGETAPGGQLFTAKSAARLGISDEMNEELAADAATFVTCYNLLMSSWLLTTTPPARDTAERHAYTAEFRVRALNSVHRATEACQAFHTALCILGLVAWRRGENEKADRLLNAAKRAPYVQLYIQQERQGRYAQDLGPFMWTERDVEQRKAHDSWRIHFCEHVLPEVWSTLGLRQPDTVPDIVAAETLPAGTREGLAADSLTELEDLLAERTAALGNDHPDVLDARHELAQRRGEAGNAAGAASAYAQLALDAERLLGADHVDTLAFRNNHATWLSDSGDGTEAVAVLEALLPDLDRVLGPAHAATIAARTNLSLARARTRQHRTTDGGHSKQGTRHEQSAAPGTGSSTGDSVRQSRDENVRYDAPSDAASRAARCAELLDALARELGADHPEVLKHRPRLIHALADAGDLGGAVTACVDLLVDLNRIMGADHHDTLQARNILAQLQGWSGDNAGAANAYATLLPDVERALGADHPLALATRHNLALARGLAGDAAGAAVMLGQSLASMLRALGSDHPQVLTARFHLAWMRGRSGDLAGAVAALDEVLADQQRVLGRQHPATLETAKQLAAWREN
ncbi:tetratricopeptide repeat protein [Streptomyces sp. AN-3]|uniref:tetratricopeptide repeat protein n=1 Tax=Streptomyces sp. AN-3 TaxID=3044177 RepID=UPI00249A400B|nr:tetratricopeptide repeat protein [Streptomyces sp. AN-3]MDI3101893.1 tetratricopeptide repeat protein [Streptomyces sp. AN-3]